LFNDDDPSPLQRLSGTALTSCFRSGRGSDLYYLQIEAAVKVSVALEVAYNHQRVIMDAQNPFPQALE
jgi:hypothetical protein